MKTIPKLWSRKWWWVTLLVIGGVVLLIRLGFWQLDRLHQKQAYNLLMAERWRQEPLDLNNAALPDDLTKLEYRRIAAQGEFDYERQILLKNQVLNGAAGFYVVTPLLLDGDRAILVARGWVPLEQADQQTWSTFNEDGGSVIGRILAPPEPTATGTTATAAAPQVEWYSLDLQAIQRQMPYTLEPAVIEQLPEGNRPFDRLPIRQEPTPLDEGNHLSYAIQWFMFAMILGIGYIPFIQWQEMRAARLQQEAESLESAQPPSHGEDILAAR